MMTAVMNFRRRRISTSLSSQKRSIVVVIDRWNVQNVDFFDSYYESKIIVIDDFVSHSNKNTFFKNIHLFVSRVKNITTVKDVKLIRKNLWTCFRDRTLKWWQFFLIDEQKRLMKLKDDVKKWIVVLEKRFKKSSAESLNILFNAKYSFENARRHRNSVDYAFQIFKAIKIIDVSIFSQLYFMYNELKIEFRRDLTRFTATITMNFFLKKIENNKKIWWNLIAVKRRIYIFDFGFDYSVNRFANNFKFQNSYNNSRSDIDIRGENLSSNDFDYSTDYAIVDVQRQSQTQYSTSYQFSNQNRININQSNRFQQAQSFFKSQTTEVAQSYAKNLSQNQQQNQSRQAEFISITTSQYSKNAYDLQFKSTLTSYYNSQNQQSRQQYNIDYNQNQQQRQSYYNIYDQKQKQSFATRFNFFVQQRVYHDEELNVSKSNYFSNIESSKLYENHYTDESYDKNFISYEKKSIVVIDNDDEIRSFFIEIKQSKFNCRRCQKKFTFNNKLHYHIRRCKQSITETHVYIDFVIDNQLKIIRSSVFAKFSIDVKFRSWRYAKILINIAMNLFDDVDEVCIDIDCEFIMIDRQFLVSKRSNYAAHVMKISSLKINDIESASLFISKKIALNFTIFDEADDESVRACFIRYVYIVDDLKTKLLISNDILNSKDMMFHVNKNKLTIKSCDNFTTSLHVTFKKSERVKRAVRSLAIIIILFHLCAAVLMKYKDEKLSHDRDFMFNFHDVDRFDVEKKMFSHIMNVNFCFVQIRNTTDKSVFIIKSERLNILMKYKEKDCYLVGSEIRHLIVEDWKKKTLKFEVAALVVFQKIISAAVFAVSDNATLSISASIIFTAQNAVFSLFFDLFFSLITSITSNIEQKYVLFFDITIYDTSKVAEAIAEVINAFFSFWQNDEFIVKLFSKKWMFIILQSNVKLFSSKMYSMN